MIRAAVAEREERAGAGKGVIPASLEFLATVVLCVACLACGSDGIASQADPEVRQFREAPANVALAPGQRQQ